MVRTSIVCMAICVSGLTDTMGVGYDQRNALIIGITMGFAVIPIIFSISEDAVFSVPKHLSSGSLALRCYTLANIDESGVALC